MSNVLRCKMRVNEVTQGIGPNGSVEYERVQLSAVTGDSEENKDWSQWTPSANFNIQINNPGAYGKLSKGHEFFVDFTPVPQADPVEARPAPATA